MGYRLLICSLILWSSCQEIGFTQEVIDVPRLANAIFISEGGNHAAFLYGIRSIHYRTKKDAEKICINTIKNNEKRYKKYGYKRYSQFIEFLAQRYCPISGRNLSKNERKLNKNWIKNVTFYYKKI